MSDTHFAGVAELILLDPNMLALSGEVQIKEVISQQFFCTFALLSLYLAQIFSSAPSHLLLLQILKS
jgi:hypothetical protein